jgi:DNA invertase Pin-like site-specific DNA recombinase
MGRLLWAIQAWYAEMENGERSEQIRAGLAQARAKGKRLGRPMAIVDHSIASLRAEGRGWKAIAGEMRLGVGTALRAAQEGGSSAFSIASVPPYN